MSSIKFIATGNPNISSTNHRCIMISNELKKRGYDSEVIISDSIKNVPNLASIARNWRKIDESKPQIVVVHRTSNFIDYMMIKKLKKHVKVIYDFDDAIFHTRFPGKLSYSFIDKIIAEADHIFAGSHYLFDYARRFNNNISLIPTAVDNSLFTPVEKKDGEKTVIGWMGNGDNYQLQYLKLLKEPLRELSKKYDIVFRIVSAFSTNVKKAFADEPYEVDFGLDKWVPIEYMPEIISDFDIGVMPLLDEPFARGKCAMKSLEYMAMGIPVVASPVGENNYVIEHGINGYLASNSNEWAEYMENIILNKDMRDKFSKNGYNTILKNYSLDTVTDKIHADLRKIK